MLLLLDCVIAQCPGQFVTGYALNRFSILFYILLWHVCNLWSETTHWYLAHFNWWAATDAAMKLPSVNNPELSHLLSISNFLCCACCQEFCPSNLWLLSSFSCISPQSSSNMKWCLSFGNSLRSSIWVLMKLYLLGHCWLTGLVFVLTFAFLLFTLI